MTLEELKASLTEEQIAAIKAVVEKDKDFTEEDATVFSDYINLSAEALGEDQIAEPARYIYASLSGLRGSDLKTVIGEDFDEELFEQWNNLLDFPVFTYRNLSYFKSCKLYDLNPQFHDLLRQKMGDSSFHSCASDLGYHLLEHCEPGDPVRDVQCIHLLLDGSEAAAAAEYMSAVEGEPLGFAISTVAQAMKDAPDYVKETVYAMPRTQGEKINLKKLLLVLLNDCYIKIGQPDKQQKAIQELSQVVEGLAAQGNPEIAVMPGIARLRMAQNARLRSQIARQQQKEEEAKACDQEAQQCFLAALNYLMPALQNNDPLSFTDDQINQNWICLKICQEMAQPKAIALLFEAIIKVEQAQTQDENRDEEKRAEIAEHIISQHIDMSKLYYAFPKELQEQFTNYSEQTVTLLKAYMEGAKASETEELTLAEQAKLAGFCQSLGELCGHLQREEESYDALVEAQILQMRLLGNLQKRDGEKMSPDQLLQRLALSVTNHLLAMHYRRMNKSQHDLRVALTSNMDIALDCFKAYPRDGRVIHFVINAALELGGFQHSTGGILAECGTYEKVIRQFGVLNNIRLDQQLCQDIAMIHSKCGQAQCDSKIRRFGDAARNLDTALKLWTSLAQNTKNPEYQKNAEAIDKMLKQIRK